jgi:hypothetical protein
VVVCCGDGGDVVLYAFDLMLEVTGVLGTARWIAYGLGIEKHGVLGVGQGAYRIESTG